MFFRKCIIRSRIKTNKPICYSHSKNTLTEYPNLILNQCIISSSKKTKHNLINSKRAKGQGREEREREKKIGSNVFLLHTAKAANVANQNSYNVFVGNNTPSFVQDFHPQRDIKENFGF